MKTMFKRFTFFIAIGIWANLSAQDLHFSQFYYNTLNLSPALSGQFDGNHRVTLNVRNQWLAVPVPYTTFSFLYDANTVLSKNKDVIGYGIGLDYDRAGDSKLSLAKLVGTVSYAMTVGKRHTVGIGFNPAIAQRRLSEGELRWDNQWTGDKYDPTISSKETYTPTGTFFFDLGTSVMYQYTLKPRTKIGVNGSLYHINRPNQSFYSSSGIKEQLPIRYLGFIDLSVGVGQYFDVLLAGIYQSQDKYQELVGSGRIRLYLNKTPGAVLNLLLGCNWRRDDALIPNLGFEWRNWLISGSYDMNTSPFKSVTTKRGGPELALQYNYKAVKALKINKKCPIY